jgi:hypothetical protein
LVYNRNNDDINNSNTTNKSNNDSTHSAFLSAHTLIDTTLSLAYTKNDTKPSNHNNPNTKNDTKLSSDYPSSSKSHQSSKYTNNDSKPSNDTNYDNFSIYTKIDKSMENMLLFENKTINSPVDNSSSNIIDIPIEFSYKDIHGMLILHCKKNEKNEKKNKSLKMKNERIFDDDYDKNDNMDTTEIDVIHTILKSLGKSMYDLYRGERKKKFMLVQRDKIASQK